MRKFSANRRQLLLAAGGAGIAAGLSNAPAIATTDREATCNLNGNWHDHKKFADILGRRMAYYEVGEGRPILFLHGNPTSSYLWRNVIPHVRHLGRCVAPDLIGMGDSEKLPAAGPGTYTFLTHRMFLNELMRVLGIDRDITFVVHDWGSGLGLDFASHNPAAIRGIAYMEAILRLPGSPPPTPSGTGLFGRFLTNEGETLILEQNVFVEQLLLGGLGQYLNETDKEEYRRPFLKAGAARWPALQWPRELPAYSVINAPIVENYTKWLSENETIPKLLVNALPGAIFSNPAIRNFIRRFKRQTEVTVYGTHYVPEFAPHAIGRALAEWLSNN